MSIIITRKAMDVDLARFPLEILRSPKDSDWWRSFLASYWPVRRVKRIFRTLVHGSVTEGVYQRFGINTNDSRWGQWHLLILSAVSSGDSRWSTALGTREPCSWWLFPDDHSPGTRHTFWIASLAKCGQPFEHLPWIRCSQHLPDISSVLEPIARPPEVSA